MDKIRKQRLRAQGRKASEKRSIMDLKGRDFLKLLDFTPEEIEYLLDLAADLKDKKKKGIPVDTLRGKNVALIFEKTSTRTRCAFEVAAHDLGMGTTWWMIPGTDLACVMSLTFQTPEPVNIPALPGCGSWRSAIWIPCRPCWSAPMMFPVMTLQDSLPR